MTGAELRAYREGAGLTQVQLARAAGVGRHAVLYWERRSSVNPRGWASRRMLAVLGIRVVSHNETTTRARGDGVLSSVDAYIAEVLAREGTRLAAKAKAAQARRRVVCGARTRKGTPCRLLSVPGRRRCKFHGGMSTGPRTAEGRARIAEAQRRRWRQRAAEASSGSPKDPP